MNSQNTRLKTIQNDIKPYFAQVSCVWVCGWLVRGCVYVYLSLQGWDEVKKPIDKKTGNSSNKMSPPAAVSSTAVKEQLDKLY